jgi:DisA bacterial checkpoint controller nucleotide-binding
VAEVDRERRRIERLKVELTDESVNLELDIDDPRYEMVIEELAYARQPPVHERRRNSYGALIFTRETYNEFEQGNLLSGGHLGSFIGKYFLNQPAASDLWLLRRMCNGRTAFLARVPGGLSDIFELNVPADELRLAWLRDAIVVQRTRGGVIKIFAPTRIYTFDEGEWTVRPYAVDATYRLNKILTTGIPRPIIGRNPYEVLDQVVLFCLHVLSPRNIGATFVWRPVLDAPWEQNQYIADVGSVPAARVLFDQSHGHPDLLATLLSVVDGACLVGPNGEVQRIEAKLTSSDQAIRLVKAEGGLRHTSAKRYSFDDPNSLVFVVSQDGPVTVYSDGMRIIQLRDGPTYASTLGGSNTDQTIDGYTPQQCSGCGRWLMIERPPADGQSAHAALGCPICGHPGLGIHISADMRTWPVKPWSSISLPN